jgi:hypothetical protein
MKKLTTSLLLFVTIANANEQNSSYLDLIIKETKDYRKFIHKSLVDSASTVDNYYFEDKNKNIQDYHSTYGIIELSAFYNEDNNLSFDQRIKIKLKLPKLKDRLRLVIESDEDRQSKDFVENHTKNKDDNFNLALLYSKIVNDSIDFNTKLGIKLNKGLDPFIKSTIEKRWDNINSFDFILSQSLKQSVEKKLESTSYFKISKELSTNFYLHNYNEYYWHSVNKENSDFFHSVYLNQRVSDKDLISYEIGTNINNEYSNLRIKRNSISVKYRHYFKSWLYSDIIPENYYRYEDNFKPKFGLRFNLGIKFNKDSY